MSHLSFCYCQKSVKKYISLIYLLLKKKKIMGEGVDEKFSVFSTFSTKT